MDILSFFKQSDTENFNAGDTIFCKGDPASSMYVVIDGDIEIHGGKDEIFETVNKGEIFGEMALIDEKPRSATATALADCTLVRVDEKLFLYMVKKIPHFSLHIMRIITGRLRHMNEVVDA